MRRSKVATTPLTQPQANAAVAAWHRHHAPIPGGFAWFCVGAVVDGCLVGAAIAGRPTNRNNDDGGTVEVLRVATDGTANAPSSALGAPYDGTFSAYTGADFKPDDRLALALALDRLETRGVKFMLSDSDTAWTRNIYGQFRIESVEVRRSISCKAASRGVVGEILVRNY